MSKEKLILCIGGGKESIPGIQIAKRMGFNIILVDQSKKAKAKKLCNYFIPESTKNPNKILKKISLTLKKKIFGVISFGNDVPYEVNFIAKKLNLNHYNLNAARILSDKFLTRKFLKKNKINSTPFYKVKTFNNLKNLINKFLLGVLKPVDSSGARGVVLIEKNTKNLKKKFQESMAFSKKKMCIFEKFIVGDQLSTETIIYKNEAHTLGISDRNYNKIKKFYPNIIEDGSDMPSKYQKRFKEKIDKLMLKVAQKLKIDNCILKGDLVINKNKIHVIEIAGRLSGGNFSSIMIPKSVGVNLVKCAIKLATNSAIKIKDLKIKYNKNISQRFFFTNKTGTLKEYNFPSWAKKSKKLVFFDFNYNKGDEIKKITNHTNRLGQIIVTDEIQKKTIQLAKHIIKKTKFVIV